MVVYPGTIGFGISGDKHQNLCNSIVKVSGSPGGLDCKDSACSAGDLGSISGLGRSPGEGSGNPLQVFLTGKSHGQRSLSGYSPWGCKESDMTYQLILTYCESDTSQHM